MLVRFNGFLFLQQEVFHVGSTCHRASQYNGSWAARAPSWYTALNNWCLDCFFPTFKAHVMNPIKGGKEGACGIYYYNHLSTGPHNLFQRPLCIEDRLDFNNLSNVYAQDKCAHHCSPSIFEPTYSCFLLNYF